MKRRLGLVPFTLLACSLTLNLPAAAAATAPQKSRRPPQTGQPAADPQTLPAGTVIVLQMETRLHSKSARASDRFTARVSEPVTDDQGRTLIPRGSVVEGHVTSASRAQSRRRAGTIGVSFDRLRLADGRALVIDGILAGVGRRGQKIDDDGNVSGGSSARRTVIFVGGSAGAGAIIGAIAGGAALGAGFGAAVGVVGALMAKGKEAVVESGSRVGMELMQPLDLRLGAGGISRVNDPAPDPPEQRTEFKREPRQGPPPEGRPAARPETRPQMPAEPDAARTPAPAPPLAGPAPPSAGPAPPPAGDDNLPVRVSKLFAERASDGSVRVLITAETPTAGWRIYADHSLDRETLEIWLRGDRPAGMVAQVISHPTITLTIPDEQGAVRRVLVHGANGDRRVTVSAPTAGR